MSHIEVTAGEHLEAGQPVKIKFELSCLNCNGQTDDDGFCVRCGLEPPDCECIELEKHEDLTVVKV